MPAHFETKILPFAPQQLFDMVADVASYPEFLPWCKAARVSDYVAYMYLGELIEYGATNDIFMKPKRQETEDYITGRFG